MIGVATVGGSALNSPNPIENSVMRQSLLPKLPVCLEVFILLSFLRSSD